MKINLTQDFDLQEINILKSLINQRIIGFILNEHENKHDVNEFYSFSPSSVNLEVQGGDCVMFKILNLYTIPELETQHLGISFNTNLIQDNKQKIMVDFIVKKIEIYSQPKNEDFDYLYARKVFNKYLTECQDSFIITAKTCQMIVFYNENNSRLSVEATQYNGSSICLSLSNQLVEKKINEKYPDMANEHYAGKLKFELQYAIE